MKKIISVTVLTMLICFVLQCDSQDKKVNVIINYRNGETRTLNFTDFTKTESGNFLIGTYKYILEDSGLEIITVWNRNIESMVIKYGSGLAPDGRTEICYGVSREGGIVVQDSTWTGYQDSTWTDPETVKSILENLPPGERLLGALYVVALKEKIRKANEKGGMVAEE